MFLCLKHALNDANEGGKRKLGSRLTRAQECFGGGRLRENIDLGLAGAGAAAVAGVVVAAEDDDDDDD